MGMENVNNETIAGYAAIVFGLGMLVLVVIYAVRGRVRIKPVRANMTVLRWTPFERIVHWYVAILFICLALTGLGRLFGGMAPRSIRGQEAFTTWADISVSIHYLLGPLFAVGVLVMIVLWMGINIPARYDGEYFKQGCGFASGKHPPAGKVNAGDKLFVYWLGLVIVGTVVCATGLMLQFPDHGQSAGTMQWANTMHVIGGLAWSLIVFGHAYLGSIGVEGAFETMTCGRADVNYVKQHHDMWAEELMQMGVTPQPSQTREEPADDV